MAYITTEEVKVIRNDIKAAYPRKDGWKFSVRRVDGHKVEVTIMEGPITFKDSNSRASSYPETSQQYKVLSELSDIINKKNFDKSEPQIDYFCVGFYYSLEVGKWNKPYKKVNMTEVKLNKLGL